MLKTTLVAASLFLSTGIGHTTPTPEEAGEVYEMSDEMVYQMYNERLVELCPKVAGCGADLECETEWNACENSETLEVLWNDVVSYIESKNQ